MVDTMVPNRPVADDWQPEKRDSFSDDGASGLPIPARLAIGTFNNVPTRLFGPLGLDRGHTAGVQPVRLNQFASHDPLGRATSDH